MFVLGPLNLICRVVGRELGWKISEFKKNLKEEEKTLK